MSVKRVRKSQKSDSLGIWLTLVTIPVLLGLFLSWLLQIPLDNDKSQPSAQQGSNKTPAVKELKLLASEVTVVSEETADLASGETASNSVVRPTEIVRQTSDANPAYSTTAETPVKAESAIASATDAKSTAEPESEIASNIDTSSTNEPKSAVASAPDANSAVEPELKIAITIDDPSANEPGSEVAMTSESVPSVEPESEVAMNSESAPPVEPESEVATASESVPPVEPVSEIAPTNESVPSVESESDIALTNEPVPSVEPESENALTGESDPTVEPVSEIALTSESDQPVESESEIALTNEPESPVEPDAEVALTGEPEQPDEPESEIVLTNETEQPVEPDAEVALTNEPEPPVEPESEVALTSETEQPDEPESEIALTNETEPRDEPESDIALTNKPEPPVEIDAEVAMTSESEPPIEPDAQLSVSANTLASESTRPVEPNSEIALPSYTSSNTVANDTGSAYEAPDLLRGELTEPDDVASASTTGAYSNADAINPTALTPDTKFPVKVAATNLAISDALVRKTKSPAVMSIDINASPTESRANIKNQTEESTQFVYSTHAQTGIAVPFDKRGNGSAASSNDELMPKIQAVRSLLAEASAIDAADFEDNTLASERADSLKSLRTKSSALKFTTGSKSIRAQMIPVLTQIFDILSRYDDTHIVVSVETNESGDLKQDLLLSQERGRAVIARLVSLGIDFSRFSLDVNESKQSGSNYQAVEIHTLPLSSQ